MDCPRCGTVAPDRHRYCGVCGSELPRRPGRSRLPKVTKLFLGVRTSEGDPSGAVLRVSRYLEEHEFSAPEGTITVPGDHARVSIWLIDRPVAAVSLTATDAEELGRFLVDPEPSPWPREDVTVDERSTDGR